VSQTLLKDFFAKVETLRWDDHRYYHQCRINQSLHFVSALSFLVAYAVVWKQPALAGLIGWLVGMVTRQSGHIFFEPRGFDTIHQCSYAHKESIKAGFNMQRKAVLISIWLSLPVLLLISPSLFGLLPAWEGAAAFWHQLGTGLAAAGRRRPVAAHRASGAAARTGLGAGLGLQDPQRSVPQRRPVLALSAGAAARRALRPAHHLMRHAGPAASRPRGVQVPA
jgi:hypothetical protein